MNTQAILYKGAIIPVVALVTEEPKAGKQPTKFARTEDGRLFHTNKAGKWAQAYQSWSLARARAALNA